MKNEDNHCRWIILTAKVTLVFSAMAYNVNAQDCTNNQANSTSTHMDSCISLHCDTYSPLDELPDVEEERPDILQIIQKLLIKSEPARSSQSSKEQELKRVLSTLENEGPDITKSMDVGEVVTETQNTTESFFTKTEYNVTYMTHHFSDGSAFGLYPMNSFNRVITGNDSSVGVCAIYLQNIDSLMSSINDGGKAGGSVADDVPQTVINTQLMVIAVSVGDVTVHNLQLSENISVTLKLKHTQNMTQPACVSFDAENLRPTSSGCYTQQLNSTHVRCLCNHLTCFAVMMRVVEVEETFTESNRVLDILTSICLSLSCFFLLLAFMTFVGFSKLRQIRYFILANLSLSLGLAQLLFLVGIDQVSNKDVCAVIAGFLHFLFLAAFCWMGVEGLEIYVKLIIIYKMKQSMAPIYLLIGYGVPTIIVAISAGVRSDGYGTNTRCWLSYEGWFHLAFIVPVMVIIIWNTVMLSVAMIVMGRHLYGPSNKKEKERKVMKKQIKGAVSFAALLGVTWLFGLLQVNHILTTVFSYIFVLLNGTQGVFIFVFQCLLNNQVIAEFFEAVYKSRIPERFQERILNLLYKGLDSSSELASSFKKSKSCPAVMVTSPTASVNSVRVLKPMPTIQPRECMIEMAQSNKNITFLSKEVEIPDTPSDMEVGVYMGEPGPATEVNSKSTGITIEEANMNEPSSAKENGTTEKKLNVSHQDSVRKFPGEEAGVSSDVEEKSLYKSDSLIDIQEEKKSVSLFRLFLPASDDSQAD